VRRTAAGAVFILPLLLLVMATHLRKLVFDLADEVFAKATVTGALRL